MGGEEGVFPTEELAGAEVRSVGVQPVRKLKQSLEHKVHGGK